MAEGAPVDVATVMCQWAAGGLAYLWVTTRRQEVGLGYGWLLRSLYAVIAAIGAVTGLVFQPNAVRDMACIAMALCAGATLVRSAVPNVPTEDRKAPTGDAGSDGAAPAASSPGRTIEGFDPRWDLAAPLVGLLGVIAAGLGASGDTAPALHLARVVVGAAFLGVVSNAMLLGHWYLVQPGLRREPLRELVRHLGGIWPIEVGLLLLPTGMIAVLTGTIDDGYGGLLGWFWVACAVTTVALAAVAMAALRERQYAAVMAATGLLYLAILTGFGTDLVARLTLAG
ncbi:MAG: hypothetical protein OXF61_12365 [Acidimicrobiaceae bacterium]|nr:hypothetical protein [Acidimicrobiaceae bacterium]MYA81634.1 hypothetical protein [Acidimicrobiales bacterium]MYH74210.1 hypothetical protein [Acidimicrobiales bacterium]MYK72244.1 hypothetical protein [Acidimicrobiales bacterium]